MSFQIDKGQIINYQITDEGYLNCYMRIARAGELEYYDDSGKKFIQVITPEELYNKDSIDSFKAKPITLDHPSEKVTSQNARLYQRGLTTPYVVMDRTVDGDFLGIFATITDQETIEEIVSGKRREISAGYDCDKTLHSDGKYYQTNRRGNHLAAVKQGRAGSAVRVMMDSVDEIYVSEGMDTDAKLTTKETLALTEILKDSKKINVDTLNSETFELKNLMVRHFTLDSIGFETEDTDLAKHAVSVDKDLSKLRTENVGLKTNLDSVQETLKSTQASSAALEAQIKTLNTDASANQGKIEALTAEKDQLTAQLTAAQSEIASLKTSNNDSIDVSSEIEKRLNLWNLVTLSNSDAKPDFALKPLEIKRLFLKERYPSINYDSADEARVDGAFEIAIASGEKPSAVSNVDSVLSSLNRTRETKSTNLDAIETARQQYITDLENEWKIKS